MKNSPEKQIARLTLDLDIELHKELKIYATNKGTNMKTLLVELIKRELSQK